jgi:hypothetical protein
LPASPTRGSPAGPGAGGARYKKIRVNDNYELIFFASKFQLFATEFQVFATPPSIFAKHPCFFASALCSLKADNLM